MYSVDVGPAVNRRRPSSFAASVDWNDSTFVDIFVMIPHLIDYKKINVIIMVFASTAFLLKKKHL